MRKQGLTELEPSQSKRRGESVWELENPFFLMKLLTYLQFFCLISAVSRKPTPKGGETW
jgi:hypothetical protein